MTALLGQFSKFCGSLRATLKSDTSVHIQLGFLLVLVTVS